jgi:hypothetical protein
MPWKTAEFDFHAVELFSTALRLFFFRSLSSQKMRLQKKLEF